MRHEGWVNNHHAFANLLKKFYCLLYTQTQKETRNIFYYTFLLFLFPFFSSFLLLLLFCFHFHINNTFMAKKFDFYDFEESLFSFHTISCFHNKKNHLFVNFSRDTELKSLCEIAQLWCGTFIIVKICGGVGNFNNKNLSKNSSSNWFDFRHKKSL